MKISRNLSRSTGFSLVEMLTVIAVIGIISAIAIPNIGRLNDSGKDARNRRNAQSIATVFSTAQAAGLDFSTGKNDVKSDIIEAVLEGGTVDSGVFAGSSFQVPGKASRETDEADGAAKYLTWNADSKLLIYNDQAPAGPAEGGGDAAEEEPAAPLTPVEQYAAAAQAWNDASEAHSDAQLDEAINGTPVPPEVKAAYDTAEANLIAETAKGNITDEEAIAVLGPLIEDGSNDPEGLLQLLKEAAAAL